MFGRVLREGGVEEPYGEYRRKGASDGLKREGRHAGSEYSREGAPKNEMTEDRRRVGNQTQRGQAMEGRCRRGLSMQREGRRRSESRIAIVCPVR